MQSGTHAAAERTGGGRASRRGPRAAYLLAAVTALALGAAVAVALKPGGSAGAVAGNLQTSSRYGHVPKWDKIPEPPPARVVTATPAQPDLKAMEGYPVAAKLPGGSVIYFAEGPQVPSWVAGDAASGHWRLGETAPASFSVTFSHASGKVPLSAGDFTIITYTGTLLHPRVTTAAGGPIPSAVSPGQTLRLKLTTALPEGDGEIRWAPVGKHILVSYFWTLEFD
jgi:hypothetical protein